MKKLMNKMNEVEYWKKAIFILCAGMATIWIYRSSFTPIYPQIKESLGGEASDTAMGSISSFYFLGYITIQVPAGMLVDKIGKKRVLVPSFILFAFAAFLVATARHLPLLFSGSVLAGLSGGAFYAAAYSLTAQNVPANKRNFSTALIDSSSAIGSSLGILLSSYLIVQKGFKWEYMMYVAILLILSMSFFFMKGIRKSKKPFLTKDKEGEKEPKKKMNWKKLRKNLLKPKMILAYLLYFASCYPYYMTVAWLPNFLRVAHGLRGSSLGLSSSLVSLTSIPGALFFSKVADHYRKRRLQLIFILNVFAAAALLLIMYSSSKIFLTGALASYGFAGKLAVEPILISWMGEQAPQTGVGTTLGVFNFFGKLSSVIAPALTGYLISAQGSEMRGFQTGTVILLGGTILFALLSPYFKKKA